MHAGSLVAACDVALHDDGGQHMAVILEIADDVCEAVFFTSSPFWAPNSRRATREELALVGYVSTRPTYLAYVSRPCWDFTPLGRTFPEHRVAALLQEFRPVQQVRQVVG